MQGRFERFWDLGRPLGRAPFALMGIALCAVKMGLDRWIAWGFGQAFGPMSYLMPLKIPLKDLTNAPVSAAFLASLVAVALPFIWIGIVLSIRRLRDAGLPALLAVWFFVPILNLIFFAILCAAPSLARPHVIQAARGNTLDRWIPRSHLGGVMAAVGISCLLGLASAFLGTEILESYGWGLFVGLPFCMGLLAALLHGYHEPRRLRDCLGVALASVGILSLMLLGLAYEGVICIVMAAPLGIVLSIMGATVGWLMLRMHRGPQTSAASLLVALIIAPSIIGAEHALSEAPPTLQVVTTIEVAAPPERVWRQVVAFAEIPPPTEWLFRAGIAYPVRAEIEGHGAGAMRHCIFSTGPFLEPIEIWDEPRLLRFSVVSNPPPMAEWTPYGSVRPPHLEGFLESKGGQFLLEPLPAMPGGGTRIQATTWYHHSMWPVAYWQLWSDAIIHRIHARVLRHIETLAEQPQPVS